MDFEFKKIDEMTGREMFCISRLRDEVFVTEQEITLPELDDEDLHAIHVFILNDNKTDALATCRIFQDEDGHWILGRVAVSKKARGQHLGRKMLEEVHRYLKDKLEVKNLSCHAQMPVKQFYEKLGYQAVGDTFDEGGISHIQMVKKL